MGEINKAIESLLLDTNEKLDLLLNKIEFSHDSDEKSYAKELIKSVKKNLSDEIQKY